MIRPAAIIAAVALLAIPAVASSQATDTILPGYWEYRSKVSYGVSSNSVKKKCVLPKDIDKFFSGPSNRHYKCTYPTRNVAGGRASEPDDFEAWLKSRSGTFDTGGMTTDEYMEWLRGPRDDLGSD